MPGGIGSKAANRESRVTSKVPGSAPGMAYGCWFTVNVTPWMPVGWSV